MPARNLDAELSKLRIDKSRKRSNNRGYGKIVLALLVLAACGIAYAFYAKSHAPIEVKVARAEREEAGAAGAGAPVLTAGGYVIPRRKIEVSSQIVGRVKDILVKRGDRVKAGDVLLCLEDEEQASQLRQAEAQLANAQARLAELRAGSRPEEIAAAKASVASAEATLNDAGRELDRAEALAKSDAISRQELDKARTAHDVAQANLQSARENARLVEIGPRKEQIDAAEAQRREAEANLAYAQIQLDYTVVRAPVSGTILEKVAEKGELVTNVNFGGTRGAKSSVVTMADLSDLQVELDINENDLPKIHLAQKCEVRLDTAPGLAIRGEVDEMSPQADRQKATVQVKARLIDPGPEVRTDVNARVTFLAPAPAGGEGPATSGAIAGAAPAVARVWVPRAALTKNAAGETIVYVASAGKAVARKVTADGEGERGVAVTEGLAGNESLIVEPLDKMADGARIVIE